MKRTLQTPIAPSGSGQQMAARVALQAPVGQPVVELAFTRLVREHLSQSRHNVQINCTDLARALDSDLLEVAMQRLMLSLILSVGTASPRAGSAQVSPFENPAPQVTAASEIWQLNSEPILVNGLVYLPTDARVFFDGHVMVPIGVYEKVPVYADATLEPFSVVYVPVGRNLMRPYEPSCRTTDVAPAQVSRRGRADRRRLRPLRRVPPVAAGRQGVPPARTVEQSIPRSAGRQRAVWSPTPARAGTPPVRPSNTSRGLRSRRRLSRLPVYRAKGADRARSTSRPLKADR